MTITEHTPEPWQLGAKISRLIYAGNGDAIAECDGSVGSLPVKRDALNAARIVACVNYCQGATNEELAGGLLGGLRAAFKALERQRDDAAAEAEALRAQRDELIATLEQVGRQPFYPSDCGARWDEGFKAGWCAAQNDNYDLVCAALAKVQP